MWERTTRRSSRSTDRIGQLRPPAVNKPKSFCRPLRLRLFTHSDVRVQQALPLPLGAKFRVFADVENVLNLLNRNWNTYKVFADAVSVTNVTCIADGPNSCARYLYSNPNNQVATTFQNASLWQIRLGARIDF